MASPETLTHGADTAVDRYRKAIRAFEHEQLRHARETRFLLMAIAATALATLVVGWLLGGGVL
jgi:hypothetical protein